jgi:hypothetical protein
MNKSFWIGFVLGALANSLGVLLAAFIFGGDYNLTFTLGRAIEDNFIGKLVSLGAALNLILFFVFIRKRMDDHAKGVLYLTILVALGTFLLIL